MNLGAILGLIALTVGCGGLVPTDEKHDAPGPVRLIAHERWSFLTDEPESLAEHAPHEIVCSEEGVSIEENVLDVDTGRCNYLALSQPALHGLKAGSALHVRLFHLSLFDPMHEVSQAHAAVSIGGDILWQRWVDIPAAASLYDERVRLSSDYPAGAPVVFHLHNHGANEWKLLDLIAEPGD